MIRIMLRIQIFIQIHSHNTNSSIKDKAANERLRWPIYWKSKVGRPNFWRQSINKGVYCNHFKVNRQTV